MFVMAALQKKKSKLKLDTTLTYHFYTGYSLVVLAVASLTTIVLYANFDRFITHSLQIPLTSTVTVLYLAFHLWMDEKFIFSVRGTQDIPSSRLQTSKFQKSQLKNDSNVSGREGPSRQSKSQRPPTKISSGHAENESAKLGSSSPDAAFAKDEIAMQPLVNNKE